MKTPVKTTKLNKKRMGRIPLSCASTSSPAASGNMCSAHCQIEKSRSIHRSGPVSYTGGSAASRCSSSCCSTPANFIGELVTNTPRRPIPTAYTYDTYQTICQTYPVHEPYSGICCCSHRSDIASVDNIDIGIQRQLHLQRHRCF